MKCKSCGGLIETEEIGSKTFDECISCASKSKVEQRADNNRYATALEVAKEFRAGRPELRSFTVAAFVRHCESRLNGEDTTSHS